MRPTAIFATTLSSLMVIVEGLTWASRQDGSGDDYAQALSTDSQGNVYIAGYYTSSPLVVFNSGGVGVAASLSNSGGFGGYVVKYASNGSLIWTTRQDGSGDDYAYALSTDYQGNVFVAGTYSSLLVVYDTGGVSSQSFVNHNSWDGYVVKYTFNSSLPSSGSYGGYVVKYAINGSLVWAARQDGSSDDDAYALSTDYLGNVYVTGTYLSSPLVVYDAGGVNVTFQVNSGSYGGYMVKYAFNGTFVWAARQDASGSDYANALSTDLQGYVYVAGTYSAPLVIYNSRGSSVAVIPSSGSYGSYVVKYAGNGTFVWTARQDGSGTDYANALATDYQGNVYVGGTYQSSPLVVYDSRGSNVVSVANNGGLGGYVVKYAGNGTLLWAIRQDGSDDDYTYAVSTNNLGNVFVAGYYLSSPLTVYDFGGQSLTSLFKGGSYGAFVAKYAFNGSLIGAARQDGNGSDHAFALSTDYIGNVYIAGAYLSSPLVAYDSGGTNVASLTKSGGFAAFVIRYPEDGFWNIGVSVATTTSNVVLLSSTISSGTYSFVVTTTPNSIKNTSLPTSISPTSSVASSSVSFAKSQATVNPTIFVLSNSLSSTEQIMSSQDKESVSTTLTPESLLPKLNLQFTHNFDVVGERIPTTTSQSQSDRLLQDVVFNFSHFIMIGVSLLFLGCIFVMFCWLLRRRKRTQARAKLFEFTTTNMGFDTTTTQDVTTAMVTSHILSIPQFLILRFGLAVRQLDEIAKGGGGSIHYCQVLDASQLFGYDGSQLVIKNLGRDVSQLSTRLRDSFYQEISMLYLFRDQIPFAKIYGFTEQPATIVLKFYKLGSLKQYILAENRLTSTFVYSLRQVLKLQVQLSQGISYMHQKDFAHCDIKPDNVLLEAVLSHLEARITDFGISRVLSDKASMVKAFQVSLIKGASISYAGPEVILRLRRGFDEKQAEVWKAGDVYAQAVVFFEMLNRMKVWYSK